MTRDDVLKEFYATPSVPGGATDRMADEILRLRGILAALLEPREEVIVECAKALRQHHEGVTWCTWEALKEQTRQRMMDEVRVVLSSAFAAAEREVSA